MKRPARQLSFLGECEHRDQGDKMLKQPGDAVSIRRGVLRSLLIACPDGCGETIVVNLDPRTGKAWHLDTRGGKLTLYPSVWLESGCESHFIVWRDKLIWFDRFELGNLEPEYDPSLEGKVLRVLETDRLRSVEDISSQLDEIPWEVSRASRRLVKKGNVVEGTGKHRNCFRRNASFDPI